MALLAYWNLRGLAHPIRLMLAYTGQDFEEKLYEMGTGPDVNRDTWLKEKFILGMDFPNLPYYFDGDIKITQSSAIMRYIARKYKLEGSTEREKVLVDLLMEEAADFRKTFITLCYSADFEELKAGFLVKAQQKIEQFENFLGNKDYFVGQDITSVDFLMYDILEVQRIFEPRLLENTPKINDFLTRIENLPAIKKYMSSDKCIERPVYSPESAFK